MTDICEIEDEDSLKAWLAEWSEENGLDEVDARAVVVSIAHRAAMRVLPIWWEWTLTDNARDGRVTALPMLMKCLETRVAANMSILNFRHAAIKFSFDDDTVATSSATDAGVAVSMASDAVTGAFFFAAAAAAGYSAKASIAESPFTRKTWRSVQVDCAAIVCSKDILSAPLWVSRDNPLERAWRSVRNNVTAPEWSFWIKWYEDALVGRAPDWKLLEAIALIDPKVWEAGAEAVAEEIANIAESFPAPAPVVNRAPAIQKAVAQNLVAIPPQITALTETIDAEIERLRGKNPQDDIEQAEIDRLRNTFETMRGVLNELSKKLPAAGAPPLEDAKEMQGLLEVFGKEFQKWPRENAADLVDSSCRVVLVGLTAGVMTAFGAPALAAMAIAGIAFGGKKLVGIGKAAKDVVKSDV